jgi:hypothetical protein
LLDENAFLDYTNVEGVGPIVKVCALSSSSSGNATFVASSKTRILIDAGLSRKETYQRLANIGEDGDKLDAILVTHEHTDHVGGLVRFGRKRRIPMYLTRLTAPAIDWEDFVPMLETFQAGASFTIGDLEIQSFTIPHDAVDPVGYAIRAEGVKIGIVTDLGYMPESICFHLQGTESRPRYVEGRTVSVECEAARDEPARTFVQRHGIKLHSRLNGLLDRAPVAGPFVRAQQSSRDCAADSITGAGIA